MSPLGALLRRGPVVLDGGLATALQGAGHVLDGGLWSARLLRDAPEAIREAHERFLRAGAQCIVTASYQATVQGFAEAGLGRAEAERLLWRSVELAGEARTNVGHAPDAARPVVAASVGPYGAYLADGSEYDGRYGLSRRALADFHRPRFEILSQAGADLLALETIPSGTEAEALLELLDEAGGTWAWTSFTCRDGERLRDGTPIRDVARLCAAHPRVAAVGINCTDPRHVAELIESLADLGRPVVAYPNSGETYDARAKRWVGAWDAPRWLELAEGWLDAGARLIGGCCRIGPDVIGALRDQLESRRVD